MADQLENPPNRNPLPIVLFLAMFPIYVLGIRLGLGFPFTELLAIFTDWESNELRKLLLLSVIPFLMTLTLSLLAIRMIVSVHRRTVGVALYLACGFLCLLIGIVIVPLLVFQ